MNILILVHPDCLSEQYQWTPRQSEEYLPKLKEHLPKFDFVIVMKMERIDEEWLKHTPDPENVYMDREIRAREHYRELSEILDRHADMIIRDNDTGRTSLNNEIGNFLLENPNSTIYLSGGYQDNCLRAVASNLNEELGEFIQELNIRVKVYTPLVYRYSKGLGFGDELRESLPWWDTDWIQKYKEDEQQSSKSRKYQDWRSEGPEPAEYSRGKWWEGATEIIGMKKLRRVIAKLRRQLLAEVETLTDVLLKHSDEFEELIAERLGADFLEDIKYRKMSNVLTYKEFLIFDEILCKILEIPTVTEARQGKTLEKRRGSLSSIIVALEDLMPELGKIIERYKIEAKGLKEEPFTYQDYAEALMQKKRRGNPRLFRNFYQRLKDEVEKERLEKEKTSEGMEGVEVEESQKPWEPMDIKKSARDVINEGAYYFADMPEVQREWLEFADRNLQRYIQRGRSPRQWVESLKYYLDAFKRGNPNVTYDKARIKPEEWRSAFLRSFMKYSQALTRRFEIGEQVKVGWMYGIVLEIKSKKRQIYNVLIVGPQDHFYKGFRGWNILASGQQMNSYSFEPTEAEQAIIDDWQEWRDSTRSTTSAQLKRNHDYGGNYLDKLKSLQKKRKKKKASKDSQIVLGIDIDDTLTDTSRFFTEALSNPDRQLNEEEKRAPRWYKVLDSGVTKKEEEEVFKQFLKDDTFAKLPPNSSAVQILQALKDKGVKIVLITARPESQLRDATERWLAEHNIPHDALFFSTNKDQIMEQEGVDFLIDDDLANAFDLEKVIVIDKPWNRGYKGKRISKLEDLLELF